MLLLSCILGSASFVAGLGSSCSTGLGAGNASASDPFWLESIKHQGISAFNSDPSSYQVFRNVKDFGAKGDGVTDDTDAINKAITTGDRCGGGSCNSSTITPAVVYFPSGSYAVSAPIIPYYFTQLIGDAKNPPTLKATAAFAGLAVIDADPYIPGGNGAQWWTNQNNFFRSVRNFVIDLTAMPAASSATGLHWQVSQATSLVNVEVNMSTEDGNAHQGIFMENGSGGFMGDIVFNGGKYGLWLGNQQFTVRNVTVNNAATAIWAQWNWGWTFQGVRISNCSVGFDLTTGGLTQDTQTVGGEAIIDGVISDTPIFVRSSNASTSLAGSLALNNIQLTNVDTAVGVVGGKTLLAGGSSTIDSWGQGNVYSGSSGSGKFTQGTIASPTKDKSLLDSSGKIVGKAHPQYAAYSVDQVVSARDQGAKGDGTTDDTKALQALFDAYGGCKIIFLDAGTYIVTSTLKIPAGTQLVGEAWSVIAGEGSAFTDQANPTVVVQAGASGSTGTLEITDVIFKTIGPTPGAIVLEWNVHDPSSSQAAAGTWDTHIVLGGADGTNLQTDKCLAGSESETDCFAAFLGLHITSKASGYFEGLWVWTADHNQDGDGYTDITVYSGRGILSESAGPVWMVGTASEHHTLYQYNLVGASAHYMGLIQTETPYYQPKPAPPAPFSINSNYSDPSFVDSNPAAWGLYSQSSSNIFIFGAGHYSFFSNYDKTCLNTTVCQNQIVNIDSKSSVSLYGLATVGSTFQLSVDGDGVIKASDNVDGFQSTVTTWTESS
ncbi:glycoside hydrolase family 55 protein [Plicaturopsis crispa FD-325 SS-3]|nr:glycoside hydrolase family 55 protein [Plicaturopsis crispa FD-325 SS-3]